MDFVAPPSKVCHSTGPGLWCHGASHRLPTLKTLCRERLRLPRCLWEKQSGDGWAHFAGKRLSFIALFKMWVSLNATPSQHSCSAKTWCLGCFFLCRPMKKPNKNLTVNPSYLGSLAKWHGSNLITAKAGILGSQDVIPPSLIKPRGKTCLSKFCDRVSLSAYVHMNQVMMLGSSFPILSHFWNVSMSPLLSCIMSPLVETLTDLTTFQRSPPADAFTLAGRCGKARRWNVRRNSGW